EDPRPRANRMPAPESPEFRGSMPLCCPARVNPTRTRRACNGSVLGRKIAGPAHGHGRGRLFVHEMLHERGVSSAKKDLTLLSPARFDPIAHRYGRFPQDWPGRAGCAWMPEYGQIAPYERMPQI